MKGIHGIAFVTSKCTCIGIIHLIEAGIGYVILDERSDERLKLSYPKYDQITIDLKESGQLWVKVYSNVMNTEEKEWFNAEYKCDIFEVEQSFKDWIVNYKMDNR